MAECSCRSVNAHSASSFCCPTQVNLTTPRFRYEGFRCVGESFAAIEEAVWRIAGAGAVPLAMGGDGMISLPQMRALHRLYPGLCVRHLDAHTDAYPNDGPGERHCYNPELRPHLVQPGNVIPLTGFQGDIKRSGHLVQSVGAAPHPQKALRHQAEVMRHVLSAAHPTENTKAAVDVLNPLRS
jgi:hypothetical protein